MANLSLDGYLTQSKRNKKEDEIERNLAEALKATKREIDSYYRKGVNDVGSTQGGSIKANAPHTTVRTSDPPHTNPGGYAVKPNAHTSIESDLEQALTATKRDLDARLYSTGANVPARDAGNQSSVKRSTLPGMTPKWEDPAGWENGLRKMKDAEEKQKTNQTLQPLLPLTVRDRLYYKLDEDDFIDKTYQKYSQKRNDFFHRDAGFDGSSLNKQFQNYYKYLANHKINQESFSDASEFAFDHREEIGALFSAPFPFNLVNAGEIYLSNLEQRGPDDIEFYTGPSESQILYDKHIIANEVLQDSYYKYVVNDNSAFGKDYLEDLKDERRRLKNLPYTPTRQNQIEKLNSIIYMNTHYNETRAKFMNLIDELYIEQQKANINNLYQRGGR